MNKETKKADLIGGEIKKEMTFYFVESGDKKVPFSSKGQAQSAISTLIQFGVDAKIVKEVRTVTVSY